ncbi:MAG: hypothetical protein JO287_18995 [Pseudonocardiales bacterium]|nr:hypothetical protein [Pseudonocardiales bacterium]
MPGICAWLAGSVLAAATTTLVTAAPASAQAPPPLPVEPAAGTSTSIACGISYPAEVSSARTNFPANTVTLRSGPSNSCIQTGQGTHDQLAQYVCYRPGDGGTWTFLRNVSTGDQGWVRDAVLGGNGSQVPCDETATPASLNLIQTLTGAVAPLLPASPAELQPQAAAQRAGWLGPLGLFDALFADLSR